MSHIKTEDFPRIRIGIGKAPERMDLAAYVTSKFSDEERTKINAAIENVSLAVATILCASVEIAMSKYNGQ